MGRADWYCDTVQGFCNKLNGIMSEFSGFGDTANRVLSGIHDEGHADWTFISGIETGLQGMVTGPSGVMAYFSALGIAIAMIFFLISVLQLVTEDRFTPEFLVKFFAKFVIAFAVILWSPDILQLIIDFGYAFANETNNAARSAITSISGAGGAFDPHGLETVIKNHGYHHYNNVDWPGFSPSVSQGTSKLGFWSEMGACLQLMIEQALLSIFELVAYALTGAVLFLTLTRILELYVRGAFLPIAAALMSDDGWKGSGGRYLRKLMALATQNAAILMIAHVTGLMLNASLQSIFCSALLEGVGTGCTHTSLAAIASCTTCLDVMGAPINIPVVKPLIIAAIICFAGLGLMFKSIGIVDDIWGAR